MVQRFKSWYRDLPAWGKGLIVAAEGGAVGFLVQWATNPQALCFSRQCFQQFGGALVGAVIVAVRNWLKQSPVTGPMAVTQATVDAMGEKKAETK